MAPKSRATSASSPVHRTSITKRYPNELWALIFEASDRKDSTYEERQKIYHTLCRVCRQFAQVAQPLLFREFESNRDAPAVRTFLLQICRRPELARYVKKLHFKESDFPYPQSPQIRDNLKLLQQGVRLARAVGTDSDLNKDLLFQALTLGCQIAESILLVALAPNIEDLCFVMDDCTSGQIHCPCLLNFGHWQQWQHWIMDTVSAERVHSLRSRRDNFAYEKLRRVTLLRDPDRRGNDHDFVPECVDRLFLLPNIEHLSCSALYPHNKSPMTSTRQLSRISELKLIRSTLKLDHLVELLNSCDKLKCLVIDVEGSLGPLEFPRDTPEITETGSLIPALTAHSCSLQTLVMQDLVNFGETFSHNVPFKTLETFENLEILEIDENFLFEDDPRGRPSFGEDVRIPKRLKILKIHSTRLVDELVHYLRELMNVDYPALEELTITMPLAAYTPGGTYHPLTEPEWRSFRLLRCRGDGRDERWSFDLDMTPLRHRARYVFSVRTKPMWALLGSLSVDFEVNGFEATIRRQYAAPEENSAFGQL